MDKELQSQVTTILQKFSDGLSTVGDVAMKQLPDIAQQYVVYGFWNGLLGSIILIAFAIACSFVVIESIKPVRRTHNEDYFFFVIFAAPCLIFSSIGAYMTVQNLLLNIFAPKLWLLLEIKSLVS